jgi:protein-disulfide isomerase
MRTFVLALLVAAAAPAAELTAERAQKILPRVDLGSLTNDSQRAEFLEVAGDTFDYAGCNDTLARCLQANVTDKHALRMAELVKALILSGQPTSGVIDTVERYYASFAAKKRVHLDDQDCGSLGDAKVQKPVHDLVMQLAGRVRLCSKYFPIMSIHPRAMISAQVAEYAKGQKKFWEMSDMLFAHQEELDDVSLKRYAKQLGLDGDKMLKEANAGNFDAAVNRQFKEGEAAGVNATPSFYFNGRFMDLPITSEFLVFSAVDEEEWQANNGAWSKQ